MKSLAPFLPMLLVALHLPAVAGGTALRGDDGRGELRNAVEAPLSAARVQQVRHEDAAAGRRLTPAELAELREQVRRQWTPRQDAVRSAESQPTGRMMPGPVTDDRAMGSTGTTRP